MFVLLAMCVVWSGWVPGFFQLGVGAMQGQPRCPHCTGPFLALAMGVSVHHHLAILGLHKPRTDPFFLRAVD